MIEILNIKRYSNKESAEALRQYANFYRIFPDFEIVVENYSEYQKIVGKLVGKTPISENAFFLLVNAKQVENGFKEILRLYGKMKK